MSKNPHNHLSALPPSPSGRRWKCRYCGLEGTLDEVDAVVCTYVYPPCKDCGQAPTCAPDCQGVRRALASTMN